MPYDEYSAERLRQVLDKRKVVFRQLRMMGGWCAMVDEKMCVGLLADKASGDPVLMARVGPDAAAEALALPHVQESLAPVRGMKGYVFVTIAGFDAEADLEHWIDLALAYNPLAKSSKKRKD